MTPEQNNILRDVTRRHFFQECSLGIGALALGSLLGNSASAAGGVPAGGHFPAKAKNVIYLFMAGGPSQLELWDYKPKLVELNGQPIPQSYIEGKRFAFMGSSHGVKLLGTRKKFAQHGQSGTWVSGHAAAHGQNCRRHQAWSLRARRACSITRPPSCS